MTQSQGRKILWVFAAAVMLVAIGYAMYAPYSMDGDGTTFLDIAGAISAGHWGAAINGYWNPGYAVTLAAVRAVMHPSLLNEQAMARYANLLIFLGTMLASLFFTTRLVKLREQNRPESEVFAVPSWAVHMIGFTLLLMSAGRELSIGAVRADTQLLLLLVAAAGIVVGLQAGASFCSYPVLGLTMGLAVLTKSFALLPSCALLLVMFVIGIRKNGIERRKIAGGAVLTGVMLLAVVGPYVTAVSRQLGRVTLGDSAKLNYCAYIDQMSWWDEWYDAPMGHATGTFTHPEKVLATQPAVFSFEAHPVGTFPLWYDPAYWTDGVVAHFWLKGQLINLEKGFKYFSRWIVGRPEMFLLLAILVSFGARWPAREKAASWAPPVAWGLLMLAIYFPVLIQDRYLPAPLMLMMLPIFAWLRVRPGQQNLMPKLASALVLLLGSVLIFQAFTVLAEARRQQHLAKHPGFGYSSEITVAAKALDDMGLRLGDKVACFGDETCIVDPTWAREAGTQILAEVRTKDNADPQAVWNAIPDKVTVVAPLQKMGLRFIVTKFGNSVKKPDGWVQLGSSDYFAYPLATATPSP